MKEFTKTQAVLAIIALVIMFFVIAQFQEDCSQYADGSAQRITCYKAQ